MIRLVSFIGLSVLISMSTAQAQQEAEVSPTVTGSALFSVAREKPFKFYTYTLENDFFAGDDAGYTNGFGFTTGTGPFLEFSKDNMPDYLHFLTRNLYIQTMPDKIRGFANMYFQLIQTPEDITIPELQEDDLPYAGLAALQSTMFAWDSNRSDQLSLFLGYVGPVTLAEQAQKSVHAIIGSDSPQGWSNQIENEAVFRIKALQTRKIYKNYKKRFGFDVLAIGGASIGTILSDAQLGLAVRWGSNLEFSHATFNLQADRQVNSLALSSKNDFFVYLGGQASLVANDILIDGNTFTSSHSVPLDHTQSQVSTGVVWKRNKLAYVFQLTSQSARSTVTNRRDTFGAFSITYPFKD